MHTHTRAPMRADSVGLKPSKKVLLKKSAMLLAVLLFSFTVRGRTTHSTVVPRPKRGGHRVSRRYGCLVSLVSFMRDKTSSVLKFKEAALDRLESSNKEFIAELSTLLNSASLRRFDLLLHPRSPSCADVACSSKPLLLAVECRGSLLLHRRISDDIPWPRDEMIRGWRLGGGHCRKKWILVGFTMEKKRSDASFIYFVIDGIFKSI
ncbi:hypothetical protein EVAR_39563_1 [Eumeta japonica]|uniref:Uncharacterized protein n=1 Tax=Eumeta variegata TaxID=151549 RepID=A0A4C1XJE9_EUMVA|nr:hypothetical protein EVAR_39563_1 [Eumeta japonica]